MKRVVGIFVVAVAVAACSGGTSVLDVAVGDCFDDPDSEIVSTLDIVDCAEPHDNEIYAKLQMSGAAFPGDDGVGEFAIDACLADFESYVGESYATSALDYFYLGPTEDSWNGGDREVLCVLYAANLAKLTGSMRAG
ncbi:MAG: septum formation family protein [Acidimicrobiia bacterium]|nr:septum formation family protein [Acidimicrobiia bacterium]